MRLNLRFSFQQQPDNQLCLRMPRMGFGRRFLRGLLMLSGFLTASSGAWGFEAGWNQAWIEGRYGSQWVKGFDSREFARVMDVAADSGAKRVRFWLFEGHQSDALVWRSSAVLDEVVALHPDFLPNLRRVVDLARARGLKLNLTLFDGNIAHFPAPNWARKNFWWNFLNDIAGTREAMRERVLVPLLDFLATEDPAGVVDQLDLMNEINAVTLRRHELRIESGWTGANAWICDWASRVRGHAASARVKWTASVGWGDAAEMILANQPWPSCVDFFDLHVYGDGGDIPRAAELVAHARAHGKFIQLGEFGQAWWFESDTLQAVLTRNFLRSAEAAGFRGAMPWRLMGEANGEKFLYIKGGRVRPAWYEFQKFAQAR
ncbi:MAG TPA: hypothetical protein PLZ57_01540 [Pseudobdellovibrionaceae bacterium]|nr:hypothetical protein [Pseudobdellovibrionaceae bacterium]